LANNGSQELLLKALELLFSILPVAPRYEMISMAIGSTYAMVGDKLKAREFLEKARDINPENAHVKQNLEVLDRM
jgi:tetratricopeptide (TPR) repeat protein